MLKGFSGSTEAQRMRRLATLIVLLTTALPAAARADGADRTWNDPVRVVEDRYYGSDVTLGPDGRMTVFADLYADGTHTLNAFTLGRDGRRSEDPLQSADRLDYDVHETESGETFAAVQDREAVRVLRRDASGGTWTSVASFEAAVYSTSTGPKLGATPEGDVVVAFERAEEEGQRVWLARLRRGADRFDEPAALTPPQGTYQQLTHLEVGSGGHVAVSYGDGSAAPWAGPAQQRPLTPWLAFGELDAMEPPQRLTGVIGPYPARAIDVAFDRAGRAAVAWVTVPTPYEDDAGFGPPAGDLHLAFRPVGGPVGRPRRIASAADFGPTLEISDAGEVLLGFEEERATERHSDAHWTVESLGYHVAFGSTALGRAGDPERIRGPLPGHRVDRALVDMNRRGDAVLAGDVHDVPSFAIRRVPGGSFGRRARLARRDLLPPPDPQDENQAWYHAVMGLAVDHVGHAAVALRAGSSFDSLLVGITDGPRLAAPLAGRATGGRIPPVLDPAIYPPEREPAWEPVEYPVPPRGPAAPASDPFVADLLAVPVRSRRPAVLPVRVRCTEMCAVLASARIGGRTHRGLIRRLNARRIRTVRVRLSRSSRRRIARQVRRRGRVTVPVRVLAVSRWGGHVERTVEVSVTRRRP